MICHNCHSEITDNCSFCPVCGVAVSAYNGYACNDSAATHPLVTPVQPQVHDQPQRVVYVEKRSSGNGPAIAGFVLSLLSMILLWIPLVGWYIGGILGIIGLVFDIVGICRPRRGLAIAGFIMLIVGFVFAVSFTGALLDELDLTDFNYLDYDY